MTWTAAAAAMRLRGSPWTERDYCDMSPKDAIGGSISINELSKASMPSAFWQKFQRFSWPGRVDAGLGRGMIARTARRRILNHNLIYSRLFPLAVGATHVTMR